MGIELEVIDLRSLVPLDRETILESVNRINKVIILHEDIRTGGMGGEIAAVIAEEGIRCSRWTHCAGHGPGYSGAV